MSKTNPRKRQLSEDPSLHANNASPPPSKRKKLSSSGPSTAFWDNLSEIWLTKQALRELNRRHNQSASKTPRPRYRRVRRPLTRKFLAELRRNRPALESAVEFLHHCESTTLKDIQTFARRGGPDLSGLRGYPVPFDPVEHAMSSSQSSRGRKRDSRRQKRGSMSSQNTKPTADTPATETEKTTSSGVYDRNFQQSLIEGGVYPQGYRYPGGKVPAKPDNWQEINQIMTQPRPSLSPSKFSDSAHDEFVQADSDAAKEKQVSEFVIPVIAGNIRDSRCVAGGIPFGNLDPLIESTPKPGNPDIPEVILKPGNPDVYYGARPEQLNRDVRTKLSGSIVPSTQYDLPIAPNFFLAVKGPDGSAAVAKRQACYDGALGARGIQDLRSHGQRELAYDNNAYTVSSIYHNGQLQMYTSHPVEGTGPHSGKSEYYMHQINTWGMTGNPDTFRQGATAFRNFRDWAEKQRNAVIARANEKAIDIARTQSTISTVTTSFTNEVSSFVAETSSGGASEYQSQESLTTQNEVSHAGETARQDSEISTSADEIIIGANPPAKRPSRSQHSGRRKRNTGESSGRSDSAPGPPPREQ